MNLFGPTFVKSMNKKSHCLVVTDDYSRFTWVFFLATKNETSSILKTFITGLENQLSLKVKIIRSDNETEFKNHDLNQFYGMKGIKREFSVPRTPQQNGIAERKNRTLIEAARTMLADSLLPVPFWAEAVNTACSGPTWLFDTSTLTKTMYYQPVTVGNQSNPSAGVQEQFDAEKAREDSDQQYVFFPVWSPGSTNPHNTDGDAAFDEKEPEFEGKKPESKVNVSPSKFKDFSDNSIHEVNAVGTLVSAIGQLSPNSTNTFSAASPSNAAASPTHGKYSCIDTSQYLDDPNMPELEDITYSDDEDDVGAEADFNNLETSITVSPIPTTRVHKDHHVWVLVDLSYGKRVIGHIQEEGIDYEEVFAPVAMIEAIRLFLAYASFMGFMVYPMDVKSAFLYGTIEEEEYVCQPPGFEDPDYPDKVYKVVKVLYCLHQAPRACQDKYVAEILRKFGLTDEKSASTPIDTKKPLLKDPDGEDVDVHTYRLMIGSLMYLTSSRPDIMFAVCACAHFQVTPKASHLHAVKKIFRYLKGKPHLGLWYPKDSPFDLVAYLDSDYAGASLDTKSITGGCQFLRCRLISWQYKKQTIMATSSTEAKYVAAASCCAQVLWIQNQLLDYGLDQTVSGKDSSNLLMADNLLKIVWYSTYHIALMKSWLVQKQTALGVNTPRCDEDRLELMDLTVFLLRKVEKVRVELSAVNLQVSAVSSIKYAMTVNPNIYVSCIKQFQTSVAIKKANDVMRLQALVDKKKVIITKATIRDALRLDDAEGVEGLPNEEIFTELARMGYEKPSTKLTFYKVFFSSQWKKQVGDISSHSTKYTSPALTQKVFANMRRVGKGFFGVDTPLFEASIPSPSPPTPPPQPSQDIASTSQVQPTPPQSPQAQPQSPQPKTQPLHDARIFMNLLQNLMDTCTTLTRRVEHLELDKISQALEITKLKQRVQKLERMKKMKVLTLMRLKRVGSAQRIDTSYDTVMDDVSKQGGIIANINADEDVVLEDAKDVAVEKFADVEDNADIQGRTAESQAQIYQIDLEHTNKVLSMQDEEELEPSELQEVVDVVTTAKIKTEVVTAASDIITAASITITADDVLILAAAPILTAAPNRRINGVVIRDP
nr:hypothetical protein [Tanacetum cinerariifolium]